MGSASGGNDLYYSPSLGQATSVTVTNLPVDGRTLYVLLWYRINGGSWQSKPYVYHADTQGQVPEMVAPLPTDTLTSSSQTFSWSGGQDVTEWSLYVGDKLGTKNYFYSPSLGQDTSVVVTGLPIDGRAIYATLWFRLNGGSWQSKSYLYTSHFDWLEDAVYYVHNDHLGTPKQVTNADQIVVWQGPNDPFGYAVPSVELIEFNVRFPGQYYDSETGLHDNWNRYYDPKTGRYVTSDPIGLGGGLNTFGYVNGNPLRYFDKKGLILEFIYGFGNPSGNLLRDSSASQKRKQRGSRLDDMTGNLIPKSPGGGCRTRCNVDYQLVCTAFGAGGTVFAPPYVGYIAGGGCVFVKMLVCDLVCDYQCK